VPTADELRLADELDDRASVKEGEASRLRAAAAILRGTQVAGQETLPALGDVPPIRVGTISEAEYLAVLEAAEIVRDWTAETLASELRKRGKQVASTDAVRTALVRLAKKGHITRTGHGRYMLSKFADDAIAKGGG
jgi:hypothetical protein